MRPVAHFADGARSPEHALVFSVLGTPSDTVLARLQRGLLGGLVLAVAVALVWVLAQGDGRNAVVCAGAITVMLLPALLSQRGRFRIPLGFQAFFAAFIFCAAVLGSVGAFYTRLPGWDIFLHTLSGALGAYGGALLLAAEQPDARPRLVLVVTASFALALGALWEIYEFTLDQLFAQQMQMGANDTMHDLVADAVGGALVAAVLSARVRRRAPGV
jgi:hypothetical protein